MASLGIGVIIDNVSQMSDLDEFIIFSNSNLQQAVIVANDNLAVADVEEYIIFESQGIGPAVLSANDNMEITDIEEYIIFEGKSFVGKDFIPKIYDPIESVSKRSNIIKENKKGV
jgi:hypothetical protein